MTNKIRIFIFCLTPVPVRIAHAQTTNQAWYFERGNNDLKVHDFRAAVEAYEKILETDPTNKQALLLLAESYKGLGLMEKMIEIYERYLKLYPDASLAYREAELMRAKPAIYNRDDVARYYRQSLSVQNNPEVRLHYADFIAEKQENLPEAIELYEFILKENPKNAEARDHLLHTRIWYAGILSGSSQTLLKAIDQYDVILKEDPGNKVAAEALPKLRQWQAALLANDKETLPQAITILEKLHQEKPSDPHVQAAWVDTRLRYAENFGSDPQSMQEAMLLYKRLLKEDPQNEKIHEKWIALRMRYAEALGEKMDTLQDAIDQYGQLLKDEPKNQRVYEGYIHMRMRYANLFTTKRETMPHAIELYEQLVKDEPDNREAFQTLIRTHLWYAGMLSENKETLAQAIEEYRHILEEDPHNAKALSEMVALRVWYASILGENPETMSRAIEELEELKKEHPDNTNIRARLIQMRTWYGGALGSKRETLAQSMEQYNKVLKEDFENPEAHLGLARGYFWLGDGDRAFRETQIAAASPWIGVDGRQSLEVLQDNLSAWRKPTVGMDAQYFDQKGTAFSLRGAIGGWHGKFDPTPFTTLQASLAEGTYWNPTQFARDRMVSLLTQFRLHTVHRFIAQLDYHAIQNIQNNDQDVLFNTHYAYGWPGDHLWVRVGAKRQMKYDSFLSLVGQHLHGQTLGAARENLGYAQVGASVGPIDVHVAPYGGWVKAQSLSSNQEHGADASADLTLVRKGNGSFAVGYLGQYMHYENDQSGFSPSSVEPLPGGYFSPQTFVSQTPRVLFKYKDRKTELSFEGGPSFQYVKTNSAPAVRQIGGECNLDWHYHFTDHWSLHVSPGFVRIATVYNRFYANGVFEYTFTYPKRHFQ